MSAFFKKTTQISLAILSGLFLLCAIGCNENSDNEIDQVRIVDGDEQCGLPGKPFDKQLKLELLGPQQPGLLGGKGSRSPISGAMVRFEPINGSDLQVNPTIATTDAGGGVSVTVTAGKATGDQFLRAIPQDNPDKSITLRFISGMQINGNNRQYRTESVSTKPISVKLVKSDGLPAVGIPVTFDLLANSDGAKSSAKILTPIALTNTNGIAETDVKLGKNSGIYNIGISVVAPESGFIVQDKMIKLLGFNVLTVTITVLGGLALFVFGMELMGDGIRMIAGENMKKVLQFFARNGIVAVLAGTFVTAVIQSSSATTVMVIGFINAGLLNLSQAIGIIFGANIGTTVTAQIISFNLSGLALPAIIIGFVISLSKKQTVKGWGESILGFGLLFFGMMMMSDELKMLADFPGFRSVFQLFDCQPATVGGWMPIGAVLGAISIGLVATMLIQSSSAAMGIVLALAAGGLINFWTAVPLLIGTNIGTTVTAILAALTANRVAKQAATAHTLFNLFGAAVMIALFYVPFGPQRIPVFLYFINAITPGNVFAVDPQNIERHIAMAHTFFNVTVVVLLLPFINRFAQFCNWLLPIPANEKIRIQPLEPNLLATPSVALKQTVCAIRTMVEDSWKMVDLSVNTHFIAGVSDKEKYAALAEAEERIDAMQAEVTAYLVKITRRPLTEPQSELVPLLMHCTNDAERIADHTEQILKLTDRLLKTGKKVSLSGKKDLRKLWNVLDDQARNTIAALGSTNPEQIKFALKDERKLQKLATKLEAAHTERLRKGKCQLVNAVIFVEMLGEMIKIGERLTNIAERTPEIQKHYIGL
ncbi:MAG: Na/Pi cotransporter family protein [Victivallales bacterium]|jgi:Na/Pi-cotransporter|nr:Na/Pi cotransporter family protein [Victivallales bacterium]